MVDARYLRYWHTRFNRLCFEGKLRRIPVELAECMPDAMGLCWGDRIAIDRYLPAPDARATLLHEMVHQWQHENGLPMHHGRTFTQWEEPCFRLTGLRLL